MQNIFEKTPQIFIVLQDVELRNVELQNADYKTSKITKGRITKRRIKKNVECYKRQNNKRSKVTKHYKKPEKVENCGTIYRKNPLGLGLG